jgi:signal transduction histidine kinase
MRLPEFIRTNIEAVVTEWEKFARTLEPAAKLMSETELRDSAREILEEIARDMETRQTPAEQRAKAEGRASERKGYSAEAAAAHAESRLAHGFRLEEIVAEYRALRASVVRLWTPPLKRADRGTLDDLIRFDEAMDEALAASLKRYAQSINRSRALLMAALGHDLRTPLGAIVNSANLLVRTHEEDTRVAQPASRILASAHRMSQMVGDLLDFTRTRLGEALPIERAPMDLALACSNAIDEMRAAHPDATIRLEPSGDLSGSWDAARIAQLLSNLIGNAVQHGRRGKPIEVVATGEQDAVILTVHNEGGAIPPHQPATLFEPLARVPSDRPHSSSGLGLGLYISREIVRAHRGTIEVASSHHDGTTIRVRLPKAW